MASTSPADALRKLADLGYLDPVPASPSLPQRLHRAFEDWLRDASQSATSHRARFDCAYNAVRTAADIGLLAQGYRTSKSKVGHHQMAIQCLVHTLGLPAADVVVLDTLRKQRNAADYEGQEVSDAELAECLKQAVALEEPLRRLLGAKGWL